MTLSDLKTEFYFQISLDNC